MRARCALGEVALVGSDVQGAARIMLRPEQIEVSTDGVGVSGTVVDVEYLGAEMLVGIRLGTEGGVVPERVTVRRFGAGNLTPGDRVGIRVVGRAVAYEP